MAKKPGTAVVDWDARLAELAAKQPELKVAEGGGKFISVKAGGFSFKGEEIGPTMDVIIIDSVLEHQYYDQPYDRENTITPVCFAFGRDEATMAPVPEDVPDIQHKTCKGCQWDAYGTADKGNGKKGKGKKCKFVIRLAVIAEADAEDIASAEVAYLKVSTTNTKAFLTYKKNLTSGIIRGGGPKAGRPLYAVVTTIKVAPHPDNQIELSFHYKEDAEMSEELVSFAENHIEEKTSFFPYVQFEKEEAPAPSPKANARKKKFT